MVIPRQVSGFLKFQIGDNSSRMAYQEKLSIHKMFK